MINSLKQNFIEAFGKNPNIFRSPGRLNLIGEHTDYNNGFVLPAAVDKAIYIAVTPREDDELNWIAADLNDSYKGNVNTIINSEKHWPDYLLGVIDQLQKAGHQIRGFDCVIHGDVPTGAGMSSSAALECATIFALNTLFNLGVDKLTMVKLAQKAENEFVGVKCGIMDQFASMFGKKDHVIKLDCRSLEYEYEPLRLNDMKIVLFDTGVKHSLASTEYNTRRQECEEGVRILHQYHSEVKSLRDVTVPMLKEYVLPKGEIVYKRCLYVVEEIQRLLDGCNDLENKDIKAFGKKMFETHEGLSKLYEVSCKELDFLVDFVRKEESVIGARMMGGGFGGCTINIIKENAIEELTERISKAYKEAMHIDLKTYIAKIENGTEQLE